jgi:hypothetical protein
MKNRLTGIAVAMLAVVNPLFTFAQDYPTDDISNAPPTIEFTANEKVCQVGLCGTMVEQCFKKTNFFGSYNRRSD